MKKPDFGALPRDFREDYTRFALMRLLPSAALVAAGIFACFRLDFSGLRHPVSGPLGIMAGVLAASCVLFGLHRFLKPAWVGTVTEIDCGYKTVNTGNKAAAEKQMMVDLTVDRGGKKPIRLPRRPKKRLKARSRGRPNEGKRRKTTRCSRVIFPEPQAKKKLKKS